MGGREQVPHRTAQKTVLYQVYQLNTTKTNVLTAVLRIVLFISVRKDKLVEISGGKCVAADVSTAAAATIKAKILFLYNLSC